MLVRTLSVLLAVCLSLPAFAQPADRVLLRYHWNAGDEVVWQIKSETTGTITMRDLTEDPVEETTTEVWSSATMPMRLQVEAVDAEGNGTITYRFGTIEMDVAAQGQQQYIRIDPAAGTVTANGEQVPMPESIGNWLRAPIKLVVSPRGELLQVDLPETMQMPGGLGGMDMTQWMRLSQQWQMTFPEQPVSAGYAWGASMPGVFGADEEAGDVGEGLEPPMATMVFTLAGWETVDGVECARVEMAGAMDIAQLPGGMRGGLQMGAPEGMQMTMGPMHMSVAGSILFDPEAGTVVSADMRILMDADQHMTGTVQTPEGAQTIDMQMLIRDMLVETTTAPG
ncbi:MAG: hypothetical protein AB7Y46_07135 [Armatimonadota bacterium]